MNQIMEHGMVVVIINCCGKLSSKISKKETTSKLTLTIINK